MTHINTIKTPAGIELEHKPIHGRTGHYRPVSNPETCAWIEYDLRNPQPYSVSAGYKPRRYASTLDEALILADTLSQ